MAEQDLGTLMESVDKNAQKKQDKASKKAEKEEKKKAKKEGQAEGEENSEDESLGVGGKIVMAIVLLIIVAIWLGIFGLLIKMDVGGFGSTVMFPVLKDVPYVNRILPGIEDYIPTDNAYNYKTVEEAVERIKELEREVEDIKTAQSANEDYIKELEEAQKELNVYKANELAFEQDKEKFYEEVVFSDKAPDINTYKNYYETIAPENAENIYKQVVTQIQADKEIEDYAKTYSSMKAKNAAAIFDAMSDNFGLVCEILQAMDTSARSDILANMDENNAAIVTQMMEP